MSWQEARSPGCDRERGAVALTIRPKPKDIGGFEVRRALPSAERRLVGPFIFFDEIGPATLPRGNGIDVRPHPHIGLATLTYLFDGSLMHRDSLGFTQLIRPGAVNWMVAGRGIVHSERSDDQFRARESRIHGIQSWVALPDEHEDADPGFYHYPAADIPETTIGRTKIRMIVGEGFGLRSPVDSFSETVYAELLIPRKQAIALPGDVGELALYVVAGKVSVADSDHAAHEMIVLQADTEAELRAHTDSHLMLLGGEPPTSPRHIWWNFVASSQERIERAKEDWRGDRFAGVPGEHERIPLPE